MSIEILFVLLLVFAIGCIMGKHPNRKHGGYHIKERSNTSRPNVCPAPQIPKKK